MPISFFGLAFVVGGVLGSFVNAFTCQMHSQQSITRGRSICCACARTIAWYDLFPFINFLWLRKRCRFCGHKISWQYPVVEWLTGFVFAGLVALHWNRGSFLTSSMFVELGATVLMAIIFLSDLKYQLIPVKLILTISGLLFIIFLLTSSASIVSRLVALSIGGGFFYFQYLVSSGRWIGSGDIYVGIFMGLLLGWPHILTALFLAYVVGAIVSLILLSLGKKTLQNSTPFATYLAASTLVIMIAGNNILVWYLSFFK